MGSSSPDGTAFVPFALHSVCGKQPSSPGHCALRPISQGIEQDEDASAKFSPQKNEPDCLQDAAGKHEVPTGHWLSDPLGHGTSHLVDASAELVPQ